MLVFYIFLGNHLSAQTVTLTVAGTNPHCRSQYPNGASYSGTARAPFGAASLVDVKFELQFNPSSNGTWGFWGPPFTLTSPFGLTQNFSNNSNGATQLTLTPIHFVRMKATIRYRNIANGPILLAEVYSPSVSYNYFGVPTADFTIDGTTPAAFPASQLDYICQSGLMMAPNLNSFSGTGLKWRLLIWQSNASGVPVTPFDINQCPWRTGVPPATMDVTKPESIAAYAGCSNRPAVFSGSNDYRIYRLEYMNDCGTSGKSVLINHLLQPSGAQVNFGIGGSPTSDALASGGIGNTGAAETFNNITSNTDGFLSWGGTESNPTLVGGFSPYLTGFNYTAYGDILGYNVKVEKKNAAGNYYSLIGEVSRTGSMPITFSLNTEIALSHNGAPPSLLYFYNNYANIVGSVYRITLTGKGVCNQNPQKIGYIKIASNCQNCLAGNTGGDETFANEAQERFSNFVNNTLDIYPNPAQDLATISFEVPTEETCTWSISSMDGRVVHSQEMTTTEGQNIIEYRTAALPTGNYVVCLRTASSVMTKKFAKIN